MAEYARDITNCDDLSLTEKLEFATILLQIIAFTEGDNFSDTGRSDLKSAQSCLQMAKRDIDKMLSKQPATQSPFYNLLE